MQLENKIALITGSATGIGAAIAKRFAREGARVMIHGLDKDEGARVAAEICASGGDADFHFADIADPAACRELVEAAVARFGGIDILVNNAAIIAKSNIETTDAALFDRVMAINTRAALLSIQAALPHFRKRGGGRVLNIGSVNAYCGEANLLAYSMSKGALMTMTRNLGDALAPENICVNQINPGWVLTENEKRVKAKDGLPDGWWTKLPRQHAPSGRIFFPEEIAHYALALVSDAPVSGSVLDVEQFPFIGRNPVKESL